MRFSMESWRLRVCHDRRSWQPSRSPASFDQGITASNGQALTSLAAVARDSSDDGDEKSISEWAHPCDQKMPAVHLSWEFLVQMRSLASIECDSVRASRQIDFHLHLVPSKIYQILWTRMHFETWQRNGNFAEEQLFSSDESPTRLCEADSGVRRRARPLI